MSAQRSDGPTAEQIASYERDGFVIVPEYLASEEVERLLGRFGPVFEHVFETGIAPDEVNYVPGVTPPERTRQLCNVWKADRTIAATTLSARNAAFAAGLTGASGLRINQDNLIWKPAGGTPLLAHQDGSYLDYLSPPNMITCWMALDDTSRDAGTIFYARGSHRWPHAPVGGQFHAPADWLSWLEAMRPPGEELDLVPIEVSRGGAAFHDAWVFHGSPANVTARAQRRSVISHLMAADTRWNPARPHAIYSRYRRPGETEIDEAFFPVLWRDDSYRSPWLDEYVLGVPTGSA
ncbi:MAG: phytanoyl-CoA dioxygenase family protein [Acidimicrobiales bacterium]|jgi:ectoine hydroxylase-related dioxygenase (phytanoyl-CoA dioxygenase family)